MVFRKTDAVLGRLAETKARILDAAEKVIATRGADWLMGDVAAAGGFAVGSIYNHFPDQRELVAAVLARRLKADLAAMDMAANAATKPIAAAAAAFAVYLNRMARARAGAASITAEPVYRRGILAAFERRIIAAGTADDPVLSALAIYGSLSAIVVVRGLTPRALGTEQAAVLLALRVMGVVNRGSGGDPAIWAASGCVLAQSFAA